MLTKIGKRWVLFGSGLSSLVIAERLGSIGEEVIVLNPGRAWGGIFSGISIGQDVFDAGMTNFEFELFGESDDDIQAYDPDVKGDVGKYVHFVRSYIERFVKIHEIPTPRMIFRGRQNLDLIITNEFEVLRELPDDLRLQIKRELERIVRHSNALHPRLKLIPGSELERAPFEIVSIANHGETFHRTFIEPFFRKVLGISSCEVPGYFHRNGWAPLFYPETLLSQFGAIPQKLKRTVFHYPKEKNFGAFIGHISAAVNLLPNVRKFPGTSVLKVDMGRRLVNTTSGEFEFDELVWGGDLQQLAKCLAVGLGEGDEAESGRSRASLELFFLKVHRAGIKTPFSVLTDPEMESPFYRATNQTECAGRSDDVQQLILECNTKSWEMDNAIDSERIAKALVRYGVDPGAVIDIQRRTFASALVIPSIEKMQRFNMRRNSVVAEFPEIHLVGPSSGYVSVTLNDHVIQALKIAKKEGALV